MADYAGRALTLVASRRLCFSLQYVRAPSFPYHCVVLILGKYMNDVDLEAKKMMATTAEAAARSRIDSAEVRNEISDGFAQSIDSIRYFVCFLCKNKGTSNGRR